MKFVATTVGIHKKLIKYIIQIFLKHQYILEECAPKVICTHGRIKNSRSSVDMGGGATLFRKNK